MGGHGSFSGNPKTEWLVDSFGRDRDMRLVEDFWYQDPDGRKWTAPAGSSVNGASIPRSLWTIVGSPYIDDYRRASIVHDVACEDPSVDRDAADRMFLEACQAGGCSLFQARCLYAGVCLGTWAAVHLPEESPLKDAAAFSFPCDRPAEAQGFQDEFKLLVAELANLPEDASTQEIDALIHKHFVP